LYPAERDSSRVRFAYPGYKSDDSELLLLLLLLLNSKSGH